MANFTPRKKPKPIQIDKFLGINEAVGQTELKAGEWIKGQNFRVTKDFRVQKRPGQYIFVNFGSGNVQAIWHGQIGGKIIMLYCWNGNVYEYDMTQETETTAIADLITEGVVTVIGTITDVKTQIFWFDSKVYFINGTDFKEYDGTTYQDIDPFIPTISINAPPAGGGTLFQEINLLTGKKIQTFVGDGSSTIYQLAETDIDSDLLIITVDGVIKVEGIDFTVNRTLGQVIFVTAPASESLVSTQWNKANSENVASVTRNKYAIDFGVSNDTNLFIWGDPENKNTFRYSGLLRPNYFPANSFVNVASNEYAITDLKPQYQSLLVFKENSTKIITPESNPLFAQNTGLNPYNFPYKDLNEAVGNVAPKMVQLIENNPVTLYSSSMWLWSSATGVEDERNAKIISDRLKLSLEVLDLSQAVTFDYQHQKEYWINVAGKVYIWNYGNDTMYIYDNIYATEFIEVNDDIYYSSNGTVRHFKEGYLADNEELGDTINCKIKGGFNDFNSLEFRKIMRDVWFSIAAASRTSCRIKFVTDRKNEAEQQWKEVEYKLLDFNDVDFNDFTFLTNRNPQPNRIKYKVKKFAYIQWLFENNTNNETLTILKLLMSAQTQGYSK